MPLRRVEIDSEADHHKAVAVHLARAILTAWGGSVTGQLFVPRATFDLFNRVEDRQRHHHNSSGESVWFKGVDIPGVPYIRLNLTTIEAPE